MKIYNQYQYSYPHKSEYYTLETTQIYTKLASLTEADLYIHIPFCSSKCGYCNLFSLVPKPDLVKEYLQAIKRQYLQIMSISTPKINSLILGGGTPSLLSIEQFEFLLTSININPQNHYSAIELSPSNSTNEKLNYLKKSGFNRVSIGVQSLIESELKAISRNYSKESCTKALERIASCNFDDFNVDVIYGIRGQTQDSLKQTLSEILKFNPTEIFIYPLYVRENTLIYNRFEVDENHTQKLYFFLKDYLNNSGYIQTSMRRFTRKKIENIVSCGFENSIAYGCGGRSYIDDMHFCYEYSSNAKEVYSTIEKFNKSEDFLSNLVGYNLSELDMKKRYIIKNLLHVNGVKLDDYFNKFGSYATEFDFFNEQKFSEYINYQEDKITLKDFHCSDFIIDLLKGEKTWI